MVRLEMALDAIDRLLPRDGHDGRVGDDAINGDVELPDLLGRLADGGEVAELGLNEERLHVRDLLVDLFDDGLRVGAGPADEDQGLGMALCEGDSRRGAQAAFAGAGDEDWV